MTDPILKPLDLIYARNASPGERHAIERQRKEARYNAERRKRIAKCWDCERFPNNCPDPANCVKEKRKQDDGDSYE